MKSKILLLLLLLVFGLNFAFANNKEEEAKNAYQAQQYAEAVKIYKEILNNDSVNASSALLYNLGNACYEDKKYGEAVLAYSKALRIDPSSKVIKGNLDYVLSKIEDQNSALLKGSSVSATPDDPSIFISISKYIAHTCHYNVWAALAIISFILTLASITIYVFFSNILVRKVGFFTAISTLLLCIVFLIFAFMSKSVIDSKDECVLVSKSAVLLESPGAESKKSDNTIFEGTLLNIVDRKDNASGEIGWYKVRLNANFIGWVKASDVEII